MNTWCNVFRFAESVLFGLNDLPDITPALY